MGKSRVHQPFPFYCFSPVPVQGLAPSYKHASQAVVSLPVQCCYLKVFPFRLVTLTGFPGVEDLIKE